MVRALSYLIIGGLLLGVVGGLAHALSVTLMLPATSVVLVTHLAFARSTATPLGLAVAIGLGHLEDLHQGAPAGTLALAHAITFLAARWVSGRVALPGWLSRATACLAAAVVLDLITWVVLAVLAESLALRREALAWALRGVHWHGLATMLAAAPIWAMMDRALGLLRLAERLPSYRGAR